MPGHSQSQRSGREPSLSIKGQRAPGEQDIRLGGQAAILHMVELLAHKQPIIRQRATLALAETGDERALGSLLGMLENQELPTHFRARAAWALGALGHCRATEALTQAMLSNDTDKVREAAAMALGRRSDPAAIEALAEATLSRNSVKGVREAALESLRRISDPRTIDRFISALANRSDHAREKAAYALGLLGDPRAIEPLSDMINDPEPHVRDAALRSLCRLGDSRGVEHFIQALADHSWSGSWSARKVAAEMLGYSGDRRVVEPLMSVMLDEAEERPVRMVAAESLCLLADDAVEPRLIDLLRDGESERSWPAVLALKHTHDSRAIKLLIAALGHPNGDMRLSAASALADIRDPKVVEGLRQALDDPRLGVRFMATHSLAQIGDVRALDALLQTISTSDNWLLRQAAAEGLGKFHHPRAAEALIAALKDGTDAVRRAAASALAGMRSTEAIGALVEALDDQNEAVRMTAVWALDEIGTPEALMALTEWERQRLDRRSSRRRKKK